MIGEAVGIMRPAEVAGGGIMGVECSIIKGIFPELDVV